MSGRGSADHRLPLSALLSQALIAFTIECDDEFEHQMPHRTTQFGSTPGAPWLISMAMWEHCLRHVPEDGIKVSDLARRAGLTRRSAQMLLKRMSRWWGYLEIAPDGAGAAREAWNVRPTPAGRQAQQIWAPLTDLVADRWRSRFGATLVNQLGAGLSSLVEALGVAVPAFMPITELGGDWRVRPPSARAPGAGRALPALLSGALLAVGVELERRVSMSPVLAANVVRVLDETGVPVRRLSALTGIADMGIENSLSALRRRDFVAVGPGPGGGRVRMASLSTHGVRAAVAYAQAVADIEREWGTRCAAQRVHAVRDALEILTGGGTAPDSPLLAGLTPYPDGWRAQLPAPHTLAHYPFISHRGGFPDGS